MNIAPISKIHNPDWSKITPILILDKDRAQDTSKFNSIWIKVSK